MQKKLGNVEKIEDFILAIAAGADVNGTKNGDVLTEYFFSRSMSRFISTPIIDLNEKDTNLLKLKALIDGGADVRPVFYSKYECNGYTNLVHLVFQRAELLNVVLSSEGSEPIVKENAEFSEDLKKLLKCLKKLLCTIENMGLD